MESSELPDEPSEQPPERRRDWGWTIVVVACTALCAVMIVGGLLFVGAFIFFAVGMNHLGSNK